MPPSLPMVTTYDLFEFLYSKGTPFSVRELLYHFQKPSSQYATFYQMLLRLQKEALLKKTPVGFQIVLSSKTKLLFQLIRFCLANDLPHNLFLSASLARFLTKAWPKKEISLRQSALNKRTFTKYFDLLQKSGFLLQRSRKPLRGVVLPHSFLRFLVLFTLGKRIPAKRWQGDYIPEIRHELIIFQRLRKKNEQQYQRLIQAYQLRFVQHSLNLEGNPITLPQTVKLLQQKIVPSAMSIESVEEVRHYQQALQKMFQDAAEHKLLTLQSLLNYHFLAMSHRPEIAGKIRDIPVHIKNNPLFVVATPDKITPRLEALLKRYHHFHQKKKKQLADIFSFAAYFHNEFQQIHPFVDGNSRTARLAMFHLLRSLGLPVVDIPLGLLEEYLSSTKGAKKREDRRLNSISQGIVLYNLKLFNGQLED